MHYHHAIVHADDLGSPNNGNNDNDNNDNNDDSTTITAPSATATATMGGSASGGDMDKMDEALNDAVRMMYDHIPTGTPKSLQYRFIHPSSFPPDGTPKSSNNQCVVRNMYTLGNEHFHTGDLTHYVGPPTSH